MARMTGEHRTAARLRNIADQQPRPAVQLLRRDRKVLDHVDELGVTPVAVARQAHRLPGRPVDGQRDGTREAAARIGANGARLQRRGLLGGAEQRLRRDDLPARDAGRLAGSGFVGFRLVGRRVRRRTFRRTRRRIWHYVPSRLDAGTLGVGAGCRHGHRIIGHEGRNLRRRRSRIDRRGCGVSGGIVAGGKVGAGLGRRCGRTRRHCSIGRKRQFVRGIDEFGQSRRHRLAGRGVAMNEQGRGQLGSKRQHIVGAGDNGTRRDHGQSQCYSLRPHPGSLSCRT